MLTDTTIKTIPILNEFQTISGIVPRTLSSEKLLINQTKVEKMATPTPAHRLTYQATAMIGNK
jgi:hypothetical protein